MKKVTLSFPNYDSLWSFKDSSKAINVTITPRRNTITGPFSSEEVGIAVTQFQATQLATSTTSNNTSVKHTETATTRPSFLSRFNHLLSVLNL